MDAEPTTAYLMTYKDGKCTANCYFCAQARGSKSSAELLSRVSWPTFPMKEVLSALGNGFKQSKIRRVCIQALNYPEVFDHLETIVKEIKKEATVPVSVSCQPLEKENIELLAKAGVDRLGVALDAALQRFLTRLRVKMRPFQLEQPVPHVVRGVDGFREGKREHAPDCGVRRN